MSTAEPPPEIRLLAGAGTANPADPPDPGAPDPDAPVPGGPDGVEDGEGDGEAPESVLAPPVVAVVVTRNAGIFLEGTLASLGAQDYPDLTVLVVDAGSDADPTDRVAAVLPSAFVRRLEHNPGFGGAANDALTAVEGAPFLLVCHDDVVLDPAAVRLLVEEAYRSNAAIVGPKLVDFDDHEILLDVGRAIDRLGGSHTGIESGELDQEQHDGVRDVFYVSSAVMLVRTDLFTELGGFDPETFPGSEDLDLCWRARLAGARIMVVPDARAAHVEAAEQRGAAERPTERDMARKRVRVVLTSYSIATLLWVVPFGLVLSFIEAIAFAVTRRRTRGARGARRVVVEPPAPRPAAPGAPACAGAADAPRPRAERAAGRAERAASGPSSVTTTPRSGWRPSATPSGTGRSRSATRSAIPPSSRSWGSSSSP